MYVHIAQIAASNIRQYLLKSKWFCVDKIMLQKYQYELDHQLGSNPLNEYTCNHTHENYKCQIQLLHDHLIHSYMLAAERTLPFTKPDTKQHRTKAGWNEHVSKVFDHALHWHRLYMAVPHLVLSLKCSPINCVHECDLLGKILSSNRTTDNFIEKAVMKFNIKSNEVFSDFK